MADNNKNKKSSKGNKSPESNKSSKGKKSSESNENAKGNKKYKNCTDSNDFMVSDSDSNAYYAQGPPSFDKVWLLFQEMDRLMKEKSRELDKRFLESGKKWQETERFLKEKSLETERFLKEKSLETERLMKEQSREADKRLRETERLVRDVTKNIGGLNNTVGEVAEAYFRGAFSKLSVLSGIKVKAVDGLQRTVGKVTGQFDIVVFGDTANIVVEVKHKLREQDVVRFFEKTFPAFKRLYPEHCRVKLFGAVAGMTIDDEALAQALDFGLLVFTQSGQKIVQLNPEGFEPREF